MIRRIERDRSRFRDIVRGRIKSDLRKFVSQGEMFGRKGKDLISIPLPGIELPHFRFGDNKKQGVGQGEGEPGDGSEGRAGDQPGEHVLEVEVPLAELAEILGEELRLPRIQPKGRSELVAPVGRYVGIRRTGPESLRHAKRTLKAALRRQVIAGTFDPEDPCLIPIRGDRHYRSWKVKNAPENSAVVVYMMDVSGSMGKEQKEVVRVEAFWINTWLKSQYKSLQIRYIVHDAAAREVDENTFFHLRESGGTKISSAYELCARLMQEQFPSSSWNVYPFHFSDGDNWSGRDTERCVELLEQTILPHCNVFCYGQVRSAYGSGQFKKDLDAKFPKDERVITSEIPDRDGILKSIQDFLGKGK
ncbi:MAG TPA: DUF444 family protein [Planctomycetota bacterium]|nr:DUF444 family protein [Planctomycetota bacterium]